MAEQLQAVDEFRPCFPSALDAEADNRAGTFRQILLCALMIGMAFQPRIRHPGHSGMIFEELRYRLRVAYMPLHAQGERLHSLNEHPRVERRLAGAEIAQDAGAGFGDERQRTKVLGIDDVVIRGVRLGKVREAAALCPVELTAVDDHTADRCPVPANELRRRERHDIRAPLEGPAQIRRRAGVVDHQGNSKFPGDLSDFFEGENIHERIANCLSVQDFCIRLDGAAEVLRIRGVHQCDVNSQSRQRIFELTDGPSIQRRGGNNMVARLTDGKDRRGLRCVTRADLQGGNAALQGGDPLFQHIGGRVADARIDIARLLQREQARGAFGALQIVRRGLVERHGAAARCGLRVVACVQLAGAEAKLSFSCEHRTLLEFDLPALRRAVSPSPPAPLSKGEGHPLPPMGVGLGMREKQYLF